MSISFSEMRANSASQEWVTCKEPIPPYIPWTTAGTARSRAAREAQQQQRTVKRHSLPNGLNVSKVLTKRSCHKQGSEDESPIELTQAEKLLGALLEANVAPISVLRMPDNMERRGIERQAMEVADRKYARWFGK